jgi:hypothetical protein
MAKRRKEQTMQWPKEGKDRQCNGQKKDRQYNSHKKERTNNAMAKRRKEQTMQWPKEKMKRGKTTIYKTLHIILIYSQTCLKGHPLYSK